MNLVHTNGSTLLLSLLDKEVFIIDLVKKAVFWHLPKFEDGFPLCAHFDLTKCIIAYHTNKFAVFDLLNKQLHPWTKLNHRNFPSNYLSRYNRIVGIV